MEEKRGIIENLLNKIKKKQIWDDGPVFCFTSDIDWASETVLSHFFKSINSLDINPTLFLTHNSDIIDANFRAGKILRGVHPNFLPDSSHGKNFKEIIDTCIQYAPESIGFRSHRAFEVTDVTHLFANEFGYKYFSHQITVFQPDIKPILHESGLINFPVFFEDGTHLYNELDLKIMRYSNWLLSPGIKIISFHPMNFVFNSPKISFMRNIKDSMSRTEYINISDETINKYSNTKLGIKDSVLEIVEFVKSKQFPIYSLNDIFNQIIN